MQSIRNELNVSNSLQRTCSSCKYSKQRKSDRIYNNLRFKQNYDIISAQYCDNEVQKTSYKLIDDKVCIPMVIS